MNKQELIGIYNRVAVFCDKVSTDEVIRYLSELDEPSSGYAEEAPRYVKNVLARLRELPLHDREVWLKAIMSEFEQDFSHAKWREGYEQGKFEGTIEREKVVVPQFVADIIEEYKEKNAPIMDIFDEKYSNKRYNNWLMRSLNAYDRAARAWLDGYEVEKEKRYQVKMLGLYEKESYLKRGVRAGSWWFGCKTDDTSDKHTRKELEQANFGWVFDCPGIEVEEVE